MALISNLSVSLTANTKGLEKGFKKASRRISGFTSSIFSLQTVLLGALTAIGSGQLLTGVIETNEKFQTLKSSLKTVTGSAEDAAMAFGLIEKFAVTTPFSLEQAVSGFIKLKALGLDPSERALRSYGNTASAMGFSLNQMIEAVADASTGEFERLKEFGIKAKSQGDQVTFTFQNVATTVGKNAEEIEGFLLGIGENQFATAMSDQMNNLKPAFSNFGASIQALHVQIGEAGLNDTVAALARNATDFINSLDKTKIQEFTSSALNGFANVLTSIDSFVQFIKENPVFAELGIVGALLFGKKGLAAVVAGQALLETTATITEKIGNALIGNSEITFGGQLADEVSKLESFKLLLDGSTEAGGKKIAEQQAIVDEITRKMDALDSRVSGRGVPQLGDFNNANPRTFEEFAAIRTSNDDQKIELKEQTSVLREIAETIRNQTSVATAG